VPFQNDPPAFARHLGAFTAPGGILVVTCIDDASFLGETLRRLIAEAFVDPNRDTFENVELLLPIIGPQLSTLRGMSRPHADWLLDNVMQPLLHRPFSIRAAVGTLRDEFDAYGGSPRMATDWRWYKQAEDGDQVSNAELIEAYLTNIPNLLDYRIKIAPTPKDLGEAILAQAERIGSNTLRGALGGGRERLDDTLDALETLAALVAPVSEITARSYRELAAFLQAPDRSNASGALPTFHSYFGRGQQYVSFVRRGYL
jgi:hypothetical protein